MNKLKDSSSLRYRALRAAVGGLMMSPLSDSELRRLASGLDLEFLLELRELLLALPLRGGSDTKEMFEGESEHGGRLAEMIYERAKSRRLSKDRVFAYMREADPRVAKDFTRGDLSLRISIDEFVVYTSPENANRLLALVSGQPEQDAYLSGITARK